MITVTLYSLILQQGHAHHLFDSRVVGLIAGAVLQAPGAQAHHGLPVTQGGRGLHDGPHRDDLGRSPWWEVQVVAHEAEWSRTGVGLGGASQPPVGVGRRRPGSLHEHQEADFVQQGAVDVIDPHQVLDAFERALIRPVRHDVLGYFLRNASDAHELRRGCSVNVHPGAGQVIQIFSKGGRGVLGRTGPAGDAYFQFDHLQFCGTDPAHQSKVLYLLKPPDTVPILHDILRNSAVDSR